MTAPPSAEDRRAASDLPRPASEYYAEARRIIDAGETVFQNSVGSEIVRFNPDAFWAFQEVIAQAVASATAAGIAIGHERAAKACAQRATWLAEMWKKQTSDAGRIYSSDAGRIYFERMQAREYEALYLVNVVRALTKEPTHG